MKKALFIVGPTAVGKTALAVDISKIHSSVLISADSVQVYRGADIISGKDLPAGRQVIQNNEYYDLGFTKLYLTSIFPPTKSFSVRDFVSQVSQILDNNDKFPIFVGGTGLYVNSLFTKIETINIPPNIKLRTVLIRLNVVDLQRKLKELDHARFKKMNESDAKNPRRLIRAIETSTFQLSRQLNNTNVPIFMKDEVLIIGLKTSMEDLREKIRKRVERRIKMGALDEAKKLFINYDNLSPQLKAANGYREMFEFLQNKISWDEAVEKWVTVDYQHAKAQMTYFNKMKSIKWFDISKKGYKTDILRLIRRKLDL